MKITFVPDVQEWKILTNQRNLFKIINANPVVFLLKTVCTARINAMNVKMVMRLVTLYF